MLTEQVIDQNTISNSSQINGKTLPLIQNVLWFKESKRTKYYWIVFFLLLLSFIGYKLTISEMKNVANFNNTLTTTNLPNNNDHQKRMRFLSIEDEKHDETSEQELVNKEEFNVNQISKFWEYLYIIRQYVLTLLLWIIIKFFDNSLIKKEGKYYLNVEFIMFAEGIAFGFLIWFGIFSFIGLLMSWFFTYNLKESVEFAQNFYSLTTTLLVWVITFICLAYFSLTNSKQRGFKEKTVLTFAIIPSIILALILPTQGMIILMN